MDSKQQNMNIFMTFLQRLRIFCSLKIGPFITNLVASPPKLVVANPSERHQLNKHKYVATLEIEQGMIKLTKISVKATQLEYL